MIYSKEKIDKFALYNYVKIELSNNETYIGWLVKDQYYCKKYQILQNDGEIIGGIPRSFIKKITFVSNGYTLAKK